MRKRFGKIPLYYLVFESSMSPCFIASKICLEQALTFLSLVFGSFGGTGSRSFEAFIYVKSDENNPWITCNRISIGK
jgi:hypothetical protein